MSAGERHELPCVDGEARRHELPCVEGEALIRGGTWAVTQIIFSALLYLIDFGTTLTALKTYYYYNFGCRHHLATDPDCLRIHTHDDNYATAFILCLLLMLLAHLSNALIFYFTLDPRLHPLRFAYFLPLIHLYRLLKLGRRALTCHQSIKDLYESQQDSTNLYNVLGASLDTIPQFILQFHIAITLGNYSSSSEGAIPIPRPLITSLIAAMLSATYNGATTILPLVPLCAPLEKACIAINAGVHTIFIVSTKAVMVQTLSIAHGSARWVLPYASISIIFTWTFYSFLLQIHKSTFNKRKWWKLAQSFALAHVSLFIGPMFVIVRYFRGSPNFYSILIFGPLLQILIELVGIGEVIIIGQRLPYSGIPCRRMKSHNDNKYLTCHSVMGMLCISLVMIMLTSIVFIMIDRQANSRNLDADIIDSSSSISFKSIIEHGQGEFGSLQSTICKEQKVLYAIYMLFIGRALLIRIQEKAIFAIYMFSIERAFLTKSKRRHLQSNIKKHTFQPYDKQEKVLDSI